MATNEDTTPSTGVKLIGEWDDIQFFNNTEGTTNEFVLHGDEDLEPFVPFTPGVADFTEDFSAVGLWSVFGSVTISGGKLNGWGLDVGQNNRAFYDLQANNGITLSDTSWVADYEMFVTASGIPGHRPFLISKTTVTIDPVGGGVSAPVIMMGVQDNTWGSGTRHFALIVEDANNVRSSNFPRAIPFDLNTTYFLRLQRLSSTRVKLSAFFDSARTIHIPGSPSSVEFDFPDVIDLKVIQSANAPIGGPGRTLTGTLDNIAIYNNVSESNSLILNEDFSTYGTPVTPDFFDGFTDATGWTTTDSTRARIEDDQGFLFFMAVANGSNDAIAFDLGAVVNPLPGNVIFTENFSFASQALADLSWPSSDLTKFDPFPNELAWNLNGGVQNTITHDLGFVLKDKWRLRFKLRTDTITVPNPISIRHIFGISSVSGGDANTSQDFIGLHSLVASTITQYASIFSNDGGIGTVVAFATEAPAVNTRFIEIIRTGLLGITVNIYSDSSYTTLLETVSQTIIGINDLTGLRFIKMYMTYQGTNTYLGAIDDIEVVDNSETISDIDWLLRYKISFQVVDDGASSQNKVIIVGLFDGDQTVTSSVNQDCICHFWLLDSTKAELRLVRTDDAVPEDNANVDKTILDIITTRTFYAELKRNSDGFSEMSIYDDAQYSNLIRREIGTFSLSGITNLKFLKILNEVSQNGAGTLDATIDDIQFWNGRSESCINLDLITPTKTITGADDANWVQSGNGQITILDGIISGWGPDGLPAESETYDLQTFDGFTMDDTRWVAEFKFEITAISISSGHFIFALADGSGDISAGGIPYASLFIHKQSGPDTIINAVLAVHDGTTSFLTQPGIGIQSFQNTDLFVRLQRISPTQFSLAVSLNQDQTNPLPGSPVFLTQATFASGTVGLDHIQSRISTSGSSNRNITGTLQDMKIFNGGGLIPWVSTDLADVFVDPCAETIQYNYNGDGSVEGIFRDLFTPFSNQWVFREKVFFGDLTGQPVSDALSVGHGLSDTGTGSSNDNVNGIFFIFGNSSGGAKNRIQACSCLNAGPRLNLATTFIDFTHEFSQGDTLFVEIVRESSTQARFTLFLDANYTFPIETHSLTVSSAITGLRFVQYSGRELNRDGIIHHTIDDVKIWDGVDVADSFGARRYLQLLTKIEKPIGKSTVNELQFNLDGGNNYAYRRSANGAVDVTVPNADGLEWNFNQVDPDFQEIVIYNKLDNEKLSTAHSIGRGTAGAGFAPNRLEDVLKWANTITKISRVNQVAEGIDKLFDTDTNMVVFGSE